ncbi:MAG TPA: ribosome biogenesis GTP-binding protein YihA/YsxC, partial [Treponemataceae bacterium]|nr:ribosome biogenesis GTP-binding protein YihA/YsxC [Treponemataceae bacterium]
FGRSNAGKSSLINMIVNRKSLVKTGSRPGMTRIINFFKINDAFILADLPGYGYAQRSAEENRAFDRMLADYAQERKELKTLFFLMDMRRLPGDVERDTVEYFEKLGVEVVLVGTKADKLGSNEIRNTVKKWSVFFNRSPELIPVTSASKKNGRDQLLKLIGERL